jgi:(2Fe-2S) ferredoxin
MLVETASAIGRPVNAGARIYTGVSDRDAGAVVKALSDNGISPEQAEIHRAPPKLVPPAALSGLSVGLFLVVLLLAIAAVRGQVAMMRPWASRLTQLGVRGSWAKSAIRRQFVIVTSAAVPLGLVAGLGPLLLGRMLVPSIPIIIPWDAVAALMASLAAAMTAAAWLSVRTLTAQESLGWLDLSGG